MMSSMTVEKDRHSFVTMYLLYILDISVWDISKIYILFKYKQHLHQLSLFRESHHGFVTLKLINTK